jgi:ABC-2 type transport system ATP-binding protein
VNDPLVHIDNVSKSFIPHVRPALSSISATIQKGQIVGIAGPDGAGKTTLIRLIAGLLKPTSGSITIAGYDPILHSQQVHELIGYMPQKFGLYEDLNVIQNLRLYADLQGVVGNERNEAFAKLLNFTKLEPFKDRLSGALSGGMKQKLGLACALIKKPKLLLLDEPSVGVDPISRRELWKMVQELLSEGITVLWSTAYLDEAERANTVILLNEGKLLYFGSPIELEKNVEGKTYKIENISGNRRTVLKKALLQNNVIDGVIQGKDVRIVTKEAISPPINLNNLEESDLRLTAVPARFEDAFMNILGGGPGGSSILADKSPYTPKAKRDIIEAQHLTKKFGNFIAAKDITFNVKSGEIFGLLGPNGAGKSTTFKMLCGLLRPTEGRAFVNGLDLDTAGSEARSHIGYMAQKFSLYGNLSVQQNLDFFSGIYNLGGKLKKQMIEEMIETFNLQQYLDANADSLPLGFKQRLALSCSVMHRPMVLFLDEPTSGVDPITRREFWNHINGLVEKGVTAMVTTHFLDEAEYCDRIALVYHGKVITIGTPDELKKEGITKDLPNPTLEDAFIHLIKRYDGANHATTSN